MQYELIRRVSIDDNMTREAAIWDAHIRLPELTKPSLQMVFHKVRGDWLLHKVSTRTN